MSLKFSTVQSISLVILLGGLALCIRELQPWQTGAAQPVLAAESSSTQTLNFLPAIKNRYPWMNPFGVEPTVDLGQNSALFQRAVELHLGWVRLNDRISWRQLQPDEGGPILWGKLAQFENELRALRAAGLTPLVIIDDYPLWAVQISRKDGIPASCGPLRTEKFQAFAQFLGQLVKRYKTPDFNVHHWELGNEPDVDPDLVSPDSVYGCWGDIDDPYYGGEHYGEMLKVVAPAIRAEDPAAKIWMGGLLLSSPHTTDPKMGRPELFLQGILQAGAAPSFDIVPYHWYPSYGNVKVDYDLGLGTPWEPLGGGTVGKARYLRQLMQTYGVAKPVSLNETGLGCPDDLINHDWCIPPAGPTAQFFEMQGDYLVRSLTRSLAEDISSFIWYTLNGPGWRYTALLDGNYNPKPAYRAYQNLAIQLQNTRYTGQVTYGSEIVAYAFRRGTIQIHIAWSKTDTNQTITVPESKFIAAYTRDGALMNLTPSNGSYSIPVGFSPIYIIRNP